MSPFETYFFALPAVAFYAFLATWIIMKANDYLDGRE